MFLPSVDLLTAALVPGRYRALVHLWEAHAVINELSRDEWDFACQLACLHALGITDNALRWLVDQDVAEHRLETTPADKAHRTFKKTQNLRFTPASCFLLSPAGLALARQLCPDPAHVNNKPHNGHASPPGPLPFWNPEQRLLTVGQIVVKHFKVPADSQELILTAFQEDNWPGHLDDPLSPVKGIDGKQRLHDAIKRLNRNQKTSLIHFEGDGLGTGVRWRFRG